MKSGLPKPYAVCTKLEQSQRVDQGLWVVGYLAQKSHMEIQVSWFLPTLEDHSAQNAIPGLAALSEAERYMRTPAALRTVPKIGITVHVYALL